MPTQVARSLEGGSEALFSVLWTSRVQSFQDLEPHLMLNEPPNFLRTQLTSMRAGLSSPTTPFTALLINFLQGSGLPCPQLFAEVSRGFDDVVDISDSEVNASGFRPRIFTWASTGCPSLDTANDRNSITVRDSSCILHFISWLIRCTGLFCRGWKCVVQRGRGPCSHDACTRQNWFQDLRAHGSDPRDPCSQTCCTELSSPGTRGT